MRSKKFKLGLLLLILIFVGLSAYQIYYVAHLSSTLHLDYDASVTFEEIMGRLENEMDQLWLIDIAQVVFASLVLLALYLQTRFLDLEIKLFKSFEKESEENVHVEEVKDVIKNRIEDISVHKKHLRETSGNFEDIVRYLSKITQATSALIYQLEDEILIPKGSFATKQKYSFYNSYNLGAGVVGEVGMSCNPIIINEVNTNNLSIKSGLGEKVPSQIFIVPLFIGEVLSGVVELAYFDVLTDYEQQLVTELCRITTNN